MRWDLTWRTRNTSRTETVMDDLIGVGGELISADSIRAQLSAENQAAIDAKLASWMGRESELGAYDAEAVLELGHHII